MANLPVLRVERLQSANLPGEALHDALDFELLAGERIGIVGASGVGKTTLLRTITGLQDAHSGAVTLGGKTPEEWGWPGFRRRVVMVSQRPTLTAGSAEENLRQPFGYASLRDLKFSRERAIGLMQRLRLKPEQLEQPAMSLSVGEQQRLCLIRALLLEPLVVCLDEPTSALDPEAALAVESLIEEESSRNGLSALIVTHNSAQAERWCRRIIRLERAGPVADGTDTFSAREHGL